jgi:hypothetical protein
MSVPNFSLLADTYIDCFEEGTMKLPVVLQLIFLALLGLYVAAKSTDYAENACAADQIRRQWNEQVEALNIVPLMILEKKFLDEACERLFLQMEKWRRVWETDLAGGPHAGSQSHSARIKEFRDELEEKGINLINAAINNCARDGMERIRATGGVGRAGFEELETYYLTYSRGRDLAAYPNMEMGLYMQQLDKLRQEKSILSDKLKAILSP